ncbi:hypothetical protein SSPO_057250 [Streptomyces antimycoticus]|uniref:Uncharacterized protein n=1 Tax=Streptomyces antimycoticus TaxID=68175 RepID=A0A499VA24_9ACTN|nr:hypothetical protein SSPO_057250 [Streptomyces antimycoticus]
MAAVAAAAAKARRSFMKTSSGSVRIPGGAIRMWRAVAVGRGMAVLCTYMTRRMAERLPSQLLTEWSQNPPRALGLARHHPYGA